MFAMRILFCCILMRTSFTGVTGVTPRLLQCPTFVIEGKHLKCTCSNDDCLSSNSRVHWQGRDPPSSVLTKSNVQRGDNGTQYTCQMSCDGQPSSINYTLLVAYGPSKENLHIFGHLPFVTDGTRILTLTCVATDTYPAPDYAWVDNTPCENGFTSSTCSLKPQPPDDDGRLVTCRATDSLRNVVKAYQHINLDLNYPPLSLPIITGFSHKDILRDADVLKCTVEGGKPLVADVSFACDAAGHVDKPDISTPTARSSCVLLSPAHLTSRLISCTCSATWTPEPELYSRSTTLIIDTEFRATVSRFEIVDSGGLRSDPTTESEGNDVSMECEVIGRPRPTAAVNQETEAGTKALSTSITSVNTYTSVLTVTVNNVRCADIGVYTCETRNDLGAHDSHLELHVDVPPRRRDEWNNGTMENPYQMRPDGITIILTAHPPPDVITYAAAGTGSQERSAGNFSVRVTAKNHSCRVECDVRPVMVTRRQLGLYRLNLSNGIGDLLYFFNVSEVYPQTRRKDREEGDSDVVTVVVAVALATIVLLVTVSFVCWRMHRSARQGQTS